ncbi:MAG: di-trans,poly-cis-decaprenylcistransferase [Clostridia bacterium]|nr:di-trans,poly-cis-decaprenylcistransferase [Clostridia bacterium]
MQNNILPAHVGLIMDGNGRWAKKRLMPRSIGHKHGMNRMIGLAEHAKDRGIKYLTVYTLSTENLARPQEELDGLFGLFRKYFTENVKKLYSKNSAVKVIGDISVLPEDIIRLLEDGENNSPAGAEFTLIFAINYGGRAEILNAVNRAVEKGEKLDEKGLASLMYTNGIPDPDLIIRTGGELRLSNFLTYQSAYSELYFTDVYFPDFSDAEFDKALENFAARDRRFGKVK